MHSPISIKALSLHFPGKLCFDQFSTQIEFGSRIAIIGRNGSGKSCLLNLLRGAMIPSEGEIHMPDEINVGYVTQTIDSHPKLSGGQRFNKELSSALAYNPDLLLLDEPTNHLDLKNRQSLLRMLKRFYGTVIVVTHDTTLLTGFVDTFWHIDNNKVHVFTGSYDDYTREIQAKRQGG